MTSASTSNIAKQLSDSNGKTFKYKYTFSLKNWYTTVSHSHYKYLAPKTQIVVSNNLLDSKIFNTRFSFS